MGAGGGRHPLVRAHGVLALAGARLPGLLVGQVQRGALLGGRQRPPRPGRGVDRQPRLRFVLHNLAVVGPRHPALVQSFIALADSGDLQLVGDVVALDFHRLLKRERLEGGWGAGRMVTRSASKFELLEKKYFSLKGRKEVLQVL